MPTYEYVCTQCGAPLEVVQSIHEPSLTECPQCQGRLRKVFGNVGVVFKGSGFYRTDSRDKKSKVGSGSGSSSDKSSEKSTPDKSATAAKTADKPAAATASQSGSSSASSSASSSSAAKSA